MSRPGFPKPYCILTSNCIRRINEEQAYYDENPKRYEWQQKARQEQRELEQEHERQEYERRMEELEMEREEERK